MSLINIASCCDIYSKGTVGYFEQAIEVFLFFLLNH